MPEAASTDALLAARGVSKSFSGIPVLREVDFEVRRGEVHALLGGNGAGKSTLMHIIAGVHAPDAGELLVEGRPVHFRHAGEARRAGIGIVFQELSLAPTLSVSENVFFARQPANRLGVIDRRELRRRTAALLAQLAAGIDPDAIVGDLPPAQQQIVEIARALSLEARVFIFDEPTSALSQTEAARLFATIRTLRDRGAGIIYISHRMAEIFEIADRVTVLRDGRVQGTIDTAAASPANLIAMMSGRSPDRAGMPAAAAVGATRLAVEGLCDGVAVRDVSFTVQAGEIVALAGLSGAGRTETALTIFGARRRTAGTVLIDGAASDVTDPAAAMRRGIGYLPEDRKNAGLFLDMSITENIAAAALERFGGWRMNRRSMDRSAESFRTRLAMTCRDTSQPVVELSGGNQQKVALAKWLLREPAVLIVDEPTRGVDVAAKAEVHNALRSLAAAGTAVLLISSELSEVLELGDRIYVMHAGRIAGELSRQQASESAVLRLATGGGDHYVHSA